MQEARKFVFIDGLLEVIRAYVTVAVEKLKERGAIVEASYYYYYPVQLNYLRNIEAYCMYWTHSLNAQGQKGDQGKWHGP